MSGPFNSSLSLSEILEKHCTYDRVAKAKACFIPSPDKESREAVEALFSYSFAILRVVFLLSKNLIPIMDIL